MKGLEGIKSLSAQCKVTLRLGHLLLLLGLPCKTHCKSSCRGLPGTRKHCPQLEGQLNAEGSPSSMASKETASYTPKLKDWILLHFLLTSVSGRHAARNCLSMKHVYRCLSLDTGWTHCTNGRSRSKIPACAKTLRSFTSTGMELLLGKTPKTAPHCNLYFSRFCISAKIFQNLRSLFCVLFLLWYCVVLLRHPPVGWVKGCHQIPSRTCISTAVETRDTTCYSHGKCQIQRTFLWSLHFGYESTPCGREV